MTRFPTALVLLAALAACGQDPVPEQQADDERSARGEVLGGTISDAMLPLDQRRSQSPPLREASEGGEGATGGADAPAAGEATTTEPNPDAVTDPADTAEPDEQPEEG